MLEYILYQLNLAMLSATLKGERFSMESCKFPCHAEEIEELNVLILAAGSGEFEDSGDDKEILDRLYNILERFNSGQCRERMESRGNYR